MFALDRPGNFISKEKNLVLIKPCSNIELNIYIHLLIQQLSLHEHGR